MSEIELIQKRLDSIERELAELKAGRKLPDHEGGWKSIVGIAKNHPEFDEIVRLGKEARDALHGWEHLDGIAADCPEFDEVLRLGREFRDEDRPKSSTE